MLFRIPSFVGIGLAVLACLVMAAPDSNAQIRVENFFPHQAPRGQTTVLHVIITNIDEIQSAEVMPPAGVTVTGFKQGEPANARGRYPGGAMWSEVTLAVAPDASPGDRELTLVVAVPSVPTGRRLPPVTVTIPTHVPAISELRALPGLSRPSAVDVQFAFADGSADLGESPYVWFTVVCGGDPRLGVVRGKASAKDTGSGVVRATIPVPAAEAGGTTPASRTCDLQVRVADSRGFESNSLKTAADVKH